MEEERKDRLESLPTRLYDAALEGNVPSLLNLLQLDPLILDRCCIERSSCFNRSPLHVAANLGHLEFVTEILRRKPRMAEELDHAQRSSPLHVSSANGHLEVVKALLAVNPNTCLVRDQEGKNPIHVAAINGRVHVLGELLRAKPQAAREQTHGGESVLHLCVKHNQLESLEFLVNVMDDRELLNFKEDNGNTVLHLAVAAKQLEMVKLLLKDKRRMAKNAINSNGLTAMDICLQSRKNHVDMEIWRSLKRAKALRAEIARRPRSRDYTWLENQRNALMVVASLIATMAFQVGVNPPGGYWQDDDHGHIAGFSVMADKEKGLYDKLLISSTIGLVSSLSVILLLISGLPCRRLFVAVLMITMWIAVSATTMTYLASVNFVSNSRHHRVIWIIVRISLVVWLFLMILLLLGHAVRMVMKLLKQLPRSVAKLCRRCFSKTTSPPYAV